MMSKRTLSELTGVSPSLITHYEKGRKRPSPDVLARLAAVLDVKEEFFQEDPLLTTGGIFFRKLARTPIAKQKHYEQIARLTGHALEIISYQPDAIDLDASGMEPKEAAAAVRRAIGFARDEPIWSVLDILGRFGIWVHELGISNDTTIDACSTRVDGMPLAFLNQSKKDGHRSRLTALHELFHMLAHSEPATTKDAKAKQEKDANEFASELLLPQDVWARIRPRRELNNPWSYLRAKGRYGISVKALMYKTKPYMTENQYRYGMIRYSKLGWHVNEMAADSDDTEVTEVSQDGKWLVEQFGSLATMANELRCSVRLAGLVSGVPCMGASKPELMCLEGGSSGLASARAGNLKLAKR